MANVRHSSAMLVSCFIQPTKNSRRCSMGDLSCQGTAPPQVRTIGVTHVLGPFCHPCPRFVPVQGAEPWGGASRCRLPTRLHLVPTAHESPSGADCQSVSFAS